MKKLLTLALLLVLSLTLVGCAKDPLSSDSFDYYLIVNGEGLGTNKMEAIPYIDKRVKSIKKEVKKSSNLYLFEVEIKEGDTISVSRCAKDTTTVIFSAQDKLSGPVTNLTESTLKISEYSEFDNGNGTWTNPPTSKVSGTVYVV